VRRLVLGSWAVMLGLVGARRFVQQRATAAGSSAVPTSIDASGRSDVTVALNAFFRGLPPSSTVAFPNNARYRVEGVLELRNRQHLTIDGAALAAPAGNIAVTGPGCAVTLRSSVAATSRYAPGLDAVGNAVIASNDFTVAAAVWWSLARRRRHRSPPV
jgi:hypothetical protein